MFQWLNYHFYGPISPIFAGVTDPQSQAFLARDLSNNELVVMKQAIFWERQRTVEGVIGFVFWDFFSSREEGGETVKPRIFGRGLMK
jgi:hypothetical protein